MIATALLHDDEVVRTLTPAGPGAPSSGEVRIELSPYSLADALTLQRELGIGMVLAQVLVRRGLGDPDDARAFLAAADRHDPGELAGIDGAVRRDPRPDRARRADHRAR